MEIAGGVSYALLQRWQHRLRFPWFSLEMLHPSRFGRYNAIVSVFRTTASSPLPFLTVPPFRPCHSQEPVLLRSMLAQRSAPTDRFAENVCIWNVSLEVSTLSILAANPDDVECLPQLKAIADKCGRRCVYTYRLPTSSINIHAATHTMPYCYHKARSCFLQPVPPSLPSWPSPRLAPAHVWAEKFSSCPKLCASLRNSTVRDFFQHPECTIQSKAKPKEDSYTLLVSPPGGRGSPDQSDFGITFFLDLAVKQLLVATIFLLHYYTSFLAGIWKKLLQFTNDMNLIKAPITLSHCWVETRIAQAGGRLNHV